MAGNSMYWLVSLAIIGHMCFVVIAQDEMRCYSCGYMLTSDGEKVQIPEKYEDIPLCTEDTIKNGTEKHLQPVGFVRYII